MLVLSPDIIADHDAGLVNLRYPRLCYNNIARGATFTASTTASGFFAQSLGNDLTHELWKPTALPATVSFQNADAAPVDYCGIAAHTLGTSGATVTLQYSSDSTNWLDIDSATPEDDNPILFLFTPLNSVYFRLSITGSTIPSIGIWYVGQALVMERGVYQGYSPIELSKKTILRPQMSANGNWIGRAVERQSVSSSVTIDNLSNAWYRRFFQPFVDSIIQYPYFFAWRPVPNLSGDATLILDFASQEYAIGSAYAGATDGAVFAQTNDDISPTNSGPRDLMSVTIPMEGLSLT